MPAGIKYYSTTAASNNNAVPYGAPEGWFPSDVNNWGRQLMADIRSWYIAAEWLDFGDVPTRTGNTTFTVPGDQTGTYLAGRRIKCTDSSTLYGTIVSAVYGAVTTVTVTLDSGNLSASLTQVAVGSISVPAGGTNSSLSSAALGNVVGVASSVDAEIALFNGTGGKTIKRASGTGYVKVASGVMATPAATIPLTDMANQAANTVLVEQTGSSTPPTALAMGASTILARLASGNIVAATTTQINTLLGTGAAATSQSTPSNPTATTSATQVMMGLAGSITPASSGKVLIIISGAINNSSGNVNSTVQIRYGTGSAPANGAAATGTTAGAARIASNSNGGSPANFSVNAVVTGLTPSTAYWLDLGAATASGTLSIQTVSISALEA